MAWVLAQKDFIVPIPETTKLERLKENIKAFMNIIIKSKPSVVKGVYVKNISLSTTMGPGIKLDVNSL